MQGTQHVSSRDCSKSFMSDWKGHTHVGTASRWDQKPERANAYALMSSSTNENLTSWETPSCAKTACVQEEWAHMLPMSRLMQMQPGIESDCKMRYAVMSSAATWAL